MNNGIIVEKSNRAKYREVASRSLAITDWRETKQSNMKHTPPSRNPCHRSGFCLSSATRLSESLTRGFASQPHGWFALIEEVPKIENCLYCPDSKAGASRHEIRFAVCFGRN